VRVTREGRPDRTPFAACLDSHCIHSDATLAAEMGSGLLQQLGYFLLDAVGLRQGGDTGLAQNFVLRYVGGCLRIVGRLHRVLGRHDVLLLGGQDLAHRAQRVDLRADVAILRRHVLDCGVQRGQRRLCGRLSSSGGGARQTGGRQIDLVGGSGGWCICDGCWHSASGGRE